MNNHNNEKIIQLYFEIKFIFYNKVINYLSI